MTIKVKKTIFASVASLLVLGTFAIAIPFIISNKKPNRFKQIYDETKMIHKFNVENDPKVTNISNEVIKDLDKKLSARMFYGPEIFSINKIKIINNKKLNKGTGESFFVPSTNEIFFNVGHSNIFNLNLSNIEDQSEYIYEILFHEYAHFLAKSYYTSTLSSNTDKTSEIYKGETTRVITKWTQPFIDQFKTLLNYNKNTPLYSKNKIKDQFVSLGSVYNQKSLFEIANGKSNPDYPKLTGKEVMAPLNPDSSLTIDKNHIIKADSLSYLYSMDELFARKYQLALMKYFPTINTTSNTSEGFNIKGWINYKNGYQFWSPYLQDIVNFRKGLYSEKGTYLNDDPFKEINKVSAMFKSQFKEKNGLSIMWNKNESIFNSNGSASNNIDHSKIKFGGYLVNQKGNIDLDNIKYVGYMNGSNFVKIDIVKEGHYYATKDFLDASTIKDKAIYFSKDEQGSDKFKISTIYNDYSNDITTQRSFDTNREQYKIVLINGETKIEAVV